MYTIISAGTAPGFGIHGASAAGMVMGFTARGVTVGITPGGTAVDSDGIMELDGITDLGSTAVHFMEDGDIPIMATATHIMEEGMDPTLITAAEGVITTIPWLQPATGADPI